MIKKSTNEYSRYLDPDRNSDFSNNMDPYEQYDLMSVPIDSRIIHSADNLIVDKDEDFFEAEGEGEDLKHSLQLIIIKT